MIKRLISLLAAVVLLMLGGAGDALAAVTARNYLGELEKIGYIDTLCGANRNAAPYRAGMSLRGANADQVLTALQSLMKEVEPALHVLEDSVVAQTNLGTDRSNPAEATQVYGMREDARLLYYEVDAYYDSIAMHRRVILNETEALERGAYVHPQDAEQAAYRVLMSLNDLQQLMEEAEEKLTPSLHGTVGEEPSWQQRAATLKDFVEVDYDGCGTKPRLEAQNVMVNARAGYMNRLMEQAKAMAREENSRLQQGESEDAHIEVYIMTSDEIAFEVVDENHQPIDNATVTMWSVEEPTHRHKGRYEPQGHNVLFDIHDFAPDDTRAIRVGYEVECDGYRKHYVERMILVGGTQYTPVLEKLRDENEVYVAGASINGEDMMWHGYNVFITPMNDADQVITAYLAKGSHGMPGSGKVTMHYNSATAVQSSVEATYTPRSDLNLAVARFTDQWCNKLSLGQRALSFTLDEATEGLRAEDQSAFTTRLNALEASNKSTSVDPDNADVLKKLMGGDALSYSFDKEMPVLGASTLSFQIPPVPFGIYIGADGTMLYSVTVSKTIEDPIYRHENDKTLWKTESQRELARNITQYAETTGKNAVEASEDYMEKYGKAYQSTWFGKCTAFWNLSGSVVGKPTYDENGKHLYTEGSFNLAFLFGAKADLGKTFYFSPPVPPIRIQFNLKAGVGLALQVPFSEKASDTHESGPREYEVPNVSFLLKVMFSVTVGPKAEVAGFDLASIGLAGSANLAMNIPLFTQNGYLKQFAVNFDMSLGVYVSLLIANFNFTLAKVNAGYINGEGSFKGFIVGLGWYPKEKVSLNLTEDLPTEGQVLPGNELDLTGSTLWNTTNVQYGLDSMPVSVELYEDFHPYQGVRSTTYTFWLNNGKVMVSRDGINAPKELILPDNGTEAYNEALSRIRSGEYTPLDLTVSPYSSPVRVEMKGMIDTLYQNELNVNAAVLALTYAKSWTEREQPDPADPEGPSHKVRVPESTGALLVMLHHKPGVHDLPTVMDVVDYLTPPEEEQEILYAAAFCLDLPGWPVMNRLVAYPFNSAMVQRTVGVNDVCLVQNRLAYKGSMLVYMMSPDPTNGGDGQVASYIRVGMDGRHHELPTVVAKEAKAFTTGLTYDGAPFYLVLNEDGHPVIGTMDHSRVIGHSEDGKSVVFEDLAISEDFREYDYAKRLSIFGLTEPESDQDLHGLFNVTMHIGIDENQELTFLDEKTSDYNLLIQSSKLYCARLLGEDYDDVVYWFETGEAGPSQPDLAGQNVTRIRGLYYKRSTQAVSGDFAVATLNGTDADLPADLEAVPLPLKSGLYGNRLLLTRAVVPKDHPVDQTYADNGEEAYIFTSAETFSHANLEIVGAVIDRNTIMKGTSAKLDFTLANKGNLPITRFSLGVYYADPQGNRQLLTTYRVDCTDDRASLAQVMKPDGSLQSVRTGISAIHRETNHFTNGNLGMWHYPEGAAPENTVLSTTLGDWGSGNSAFSKALMPESLYSYSASLGFPENFEKGYDLYIHIDSIEVPNRWSNILNDSLTGRSAEDDRIVIDLTETDTLLLRPAELTGGDGAYFNRSVRSVPLKASTTPSTALEINNAQIEANYHLFTRDGESYAAIAIAQRGDTTGQNLPGGIVLRAYVNDEKAPSYIHRFRNHTSDTFAFNLSLPIQTLSGGRDARIIRVVVSDEAEGNMDTTDINNVLTIYPEKQPDPSIYLNVTAVEPITVVKEGEDATFTALVDTNDLSYVYQWQTLEKGQWSDLPDETGRVLRLSQCELSMDDRVYRCAVTTGSGRQALSNTVLLKVEKSVPHTGDSTPLGLLLMALFVGILGLLTVARKER